MTLRTDYTIFLRQRLASRVHELRAALASLVADPPAAGCHVEIVIFPDDGVTERPPIYVHAFPPTGPQLYEVGGLRACNDLLTSMQPLIELEEYDGFLVWEGEGEDRMVAMQQPIDGVEEELLKQWVADAWQGLDFRNYKCRTSIAVHDGDTEAISVPRSADSAS